MQGMGHHREAQGLAHPFPTSHATMRPQRGTTGQGSQELKPELFPQSCTLNCRKFLSPRLPFVASTVRALCQDPVPPFIAPGYALPGPQLCAQG